MIRYINKYIDSKQHAWSSTTKKSEISRLSAVSHLMALPPEKIYETLAETKKPYTVKTIFVRLTAYMDWLVDEGTMDGPNLFKKFMKDNARLFKHSYERKEVKVTYEDALKGIKGISHRGIRKKALELLGSGMRLVDYNNFDSATSTTKGKGGKVRKVVMPNIPGPKWNGNEWKLRRELKKIGLAPHDLRKLFATKLLREGINILDVSRLMGHASINTTEKYLQDIESEKLGLEVERIMTL